MATVKLFGGLRAFTEERVQEVPGETAGAVLNQLCAGNDSLRQAIFASERLLPHVRVMVNGRDVELDQGLETPVGPGDQIAVFPPIAGGQALNNSN